MTPTKPGFYWAKWMIADDHLPEGVTAFKTWEPVEVYDADDLGIAGRKDNLRVWMSGSEHSQALDCFHWGDELIPPIDKTAEIRKATQVAERAAALSRWEKMTINEREEFLQAKRRKA